MMFTMKAVLSFSFLRAFMAALAFLLLLDGSLTAAGEPLRILLFNSSDFYERPTVQKVGIACSEGLRIATHTIMKGGGLEGKFPVEIVNHNIALNPNRMKLAISTLNDNDKDGAASRIIAAFCLIGDSLFSEAMKLLPGKNLQLFSPYVGGSNSYFWSEYAVHTSPNPYLELLAQITYVVIHNQIRRVGFMYSINRNFAEEKLGEARALLRTFGLALTAVFTMDANIDDPNKQTSWDFEDEWRRFYDEEPDAVLIWGVPAPTTTKFVIRVSSAINSRRFLVVASNTMSPTVAECIELLHNQGFDLSRLKVALTSIVPLFNDDKFTISRQFREEVAQAERDGLYLKWNASVMSADTGAGVLTMSFWAGAHVMFQSLELLGGVANRTLLRHKMFDGFLANVGDHHFGIYTRNCTTMAGMLDGHSSTYPPHRWGCTCNEGAHTVNMFALDIRRGTADHVIHYSSSIDDCTISELKIDRSVVVYRPEVNDRLGESLEDASAFFRLQRSSKHPLLHGDATFVPMSKKNILTHNIDKSLSPSHQELLALQKNHYITAASLGYVTLPLGEDITIPLVAPMALLPRPFPGFQRNVIHITATVDQQVYAACAYLYYIQKGGLPDYAHQEYELADILTERVHLIVLDTAVPDVAPMTIEGSRAMLDFMRKSLNTFLQEAGDLFYGETEAQLKGSISGLPADANFAFYIGISSEPEGFTFLNYILDKHPSLKVLIPFNSVLLHWDGLMASIPAEKQKRVLFATSTPPFNPPKNQTKSSLYVQAFYDLTENQKFLRKPLPLLSFMSMRFFQSVAQRIVGQVSPKSFLDMIYSLSLIVIDDALVFGPYYDASCEEVPGKCERNYPTSNLFIVSLEQAAGELETLDDIFHIYPSMDMHPLPTFRLKGWHIAVIAISGVMFILLIVAIILCVFYWRRRREAERIVASAPKDESLPFSIIFTDIQRSTSLWAEIPDQMGPALDTHHRLIRELITQHNGYEVKTIGDAFMIAFKKASDALSLASHLQFAFYEFNWGPECDIDECYKEFEMQFIEEKQGDEDFKEQTINLTCNLRAEEYREQWNGLRVRVGINTGFGTIKLDTTTHRYDYYGGITNVASRTEAAAYGGQVVVTDSCRREYEQECIEDAAVAKDYVWVTFGPQPLRGVPEPVILHQLSTVPGRLFGPLRLDVMPLNENEESETGDGSNSTSNTINDDDMLTAISFVLIGAMMSCLPKAKRHTEYQALCKAWRVKVRKNYVFSNRFLPRAAPVQGGEASLTGTKGLRRTDTKGDMSVDNTSLRAPPSITEGYAPPSLNNGTIAGSMASTNSSNAARRRAAAMAQDERYLGPLARRISSVTMKRLPPAISKLLIAAAALDRRNSHHGSMFEFTNASLNGSIGNGPGTQSPDQPSFIPANCLPLGSMASASSHNGLLVTNRSRRRSNATTDSYAAALLLRHLSQLKANPMPAASLDFSSGPAIPNNVANGSITNSIPLADYSTSSQVASGRVNPFSSVTGPNTPYQGSLASGAHFPPAPSADLIEVASIHGD